MNVVFLGTLAEPDIRIFIDALMFLSVLGAAALMLLALFGKVDSAARHRTATVKLDTARPPSSSSWHPVHHAGRDVGHRCTHGNSPAPAEQPERHPVFLQFNKRPTSQQL